MKRQLNYEYLDTIIAMLAGWAINSAMIIVAAATFFHAGQHVTELETAQQMLRPLLGSAAAIVFAVALLFAGLSSSVTAGMAGGSILAGIWCEPYNIKDLHTRWGVFLTLLGAAVIIFFIRNPFQGLLISQMLLSVQLPWTVITQILLTSKRSVMGKFANTLALNITLWSVAVVVSVLNVLLLWSLLKPMFG